MLTPSVARHALGEAGVALPKHHSCRAGIAAGEALVCGPASRSPDFTAARPRAAVATRIYARLPRLPARTSPASAAAFPCVRQPSPDDRPGPAQDARAKGAGARRCRHKSRAIVMSAAEPWLILPLEGQSGGRNRDVSSGNQGSDRVRQDGRAAAAQAGPREAPCPPIPHAC